MDEHSVSLFQADMCHAEEKQSSLSSCDSFANHSALSVLDQGGVLENITFWPELKKHIDIPNPSTPKQVCCVVCQEKLSIRGLYQTVELGIWEKCCVLPCGHLIGMDCLESHINCYTSGLSGNWTREGSDVPNCPSCPICRMSLVFQRCRHIIWGIVLPATWDDDFGFNVPPICKDVEAIPQDCNRCHRTKTRHQVEELLNYMFNEDSTVPECEASQGKRFLRDFAQMTETRTSRSLSWARFDR